jgi:DNA-binding transcriptional LysR family regulator
MSIRHLRIFLAVYQEMNITKAAAKLHLAQPSVSLAIKELEENYHIQLFDRINRRLFITQKGEAFYEYAFHIVSLFDEMENRMVSQDIPLGINLGSSITIGNYVVPQILQKFHKMYPSCQVHVQVQNSKQIVQGVIKNELDLGVVEDQVLNNHLIAVPFMQDRLYFLCSSKHPLAKKKCIGLEEICEYPFLMREPGSAAREITDGLLKSRQLKPYILWESVSNQAILQALKSNNGIAIMSGKLAEEEVNKGNIVMLPCNPDVFQRDFTLIYYKKKYRTLALEKLVQLFTSKI